MTETRTARVWYGSNTRRFLEITHETTPPLDIGDRQFLFVARMNPSMGIPEEGMLKILKDRLAERRCITNAHSGAI